MPLSRTLFLLGLLTFLRAPQALAQAPAAMTHTLPDFTLRLDPSSQTATHLLPSSVGGFDFLPSDRQSQRQGNGFHHLGDLTLRIRTSPTAPWQSYDTAAARQPVRPLPVSGPAIASADLGPTLPASCPLTITRTWLVRDGQLVLEFMLKNKAGSAVEVGGLGLPVIFNNILTDRRLPDAHEHCVFFDPYVGLDGGYLQVTRLKGTGPALLVVPEGKTPFEAYAPLSEPMRPNQTFEGAFAWQVHSAALAQNEWRNATPWNPPSQTTLAPGETRHYGLRFLLAPGVRQLEATLRAHQRPVAVGVPGYILPQDLSAQLFLHAPQKVTSIAVEPKDALTLRAAGTTPSGWKRYTVRAKGWGRARVTVTYADNTHQTIHYYAIKPAAQTVKDLGNFLFTRQWYDNPSDPFGRSPSVLSYDREVNRLVTQDSRVWIAGLGDEGGSGSYVAAALKSFGQPDPEEVRRLEAFVDGVLWGKIQFKDGPNRYGVRKSVFFYDPKEMPSFAYDPQRDWRSWTSWNKPASEDIGRGYNYPHVVSVYWSLYQIARNHPGLARSHSWEWYLEQAYQTLLFFTSRAPEGWYRIGYVDVGMMEGTVFLEVLRDLQREGWTEKATILEARMKARADHWKQEEYPFGSEMAWDSTGQEEVYGWCQYFGYEDKALISLNSILGYMPTLPHWGYNGCARRYWDFLYGGKLTRIERQLHHYGSGLNALPVLEHYRRHPDDTYLLRVGYGGMMGALSNIDEEGFASVAFHSYPTTLKWDAYSGDYGPNFLGHALNTGTYVLQHPELGWLAFGGEVTNQRSTISVTPRDSFRKRLYLAPLGLWLTLDAGTFESVTIDPKTRRVRVGLAAATVHAPEAYLRIEQPAKVAGVGRFHAPPSLATRRDTVTVRLAPSGITWVELTDRER